MRRKVCMECSGLENPARCCEGRYDSDHIGPWTLWQGNIRSELMVIGQDWGDTKYFAKNYGRDGADSPTNRNLRHLLSVAGVHIDLPRLDDCGRGSVFFTNAILCLKKGGMQAAVDRTWFANCGTRFLRPTIELVTPTVVVALGQQAYRAISEAYRIRPERFRRAVEAQPSVLPSGTSLVPVYHCGARTLNTHRCLSAQELDWDRVRRALADHRCGGDDEPTSGA